MFNHRSCAGRFCKANNFAHWSRARFFSSALTTFLVVMLAACSSEPPPTPPAELKATTGDVKLLRLWSSKAGESGRGLFEPLVIEDQVIVANKDGLVTAFARDTGMRRWRSDLDVNLTSGVGGESDLIFVSDVNAIVHALDPATGEEKWQAQASSEVLKPVVAGYGIAALRSADGRLATLELDDGSERWSISETPPALTLNGYSRPLLLDGGVLVGLDDGRLIALETASGSIIWETVLSVPRGRSEVERLVDIDADIVIDDAGIYVANYQGKAARLEPARGQIVWSTPLSAGSGIALNDTGLVVIDEDDSIIKFDKEDGTELWKNDTMPGRRLSPPAFTAEGDIIIGDVEGYLHVLDSDTGEILGRTRPAKKPILARPLLVEETVYVQASDGVLTAYRFSR
ncbi:outer membrane protein assembly factor BamB [Granulosicoccus sp.]|nr:outer membrane protein assembly factor BamB [Granulosicoccus sp.]